MAAFALGLLEHGPLLGATDGHLHDKTSARGDLLGLDGNLLS